MITACAVGAQSADVGDAIDQAIALYCRAMGHEPPPRGAKAVIDGPAGTLSLPLLPANSCVTVGRSPDVRTGLFTASIASLDEDGEPVRGGAGTDFMSFYVAASVTSDDPQGASRADVFREACEAYCRTWDVEPQGVLIQSEYDYHPELLPGSPVGTLSTHRDYDGDLGQWLSGEDARTTTMTTTVTVELEGRP